ncbi:MAG TPA: acVLRF1 family peptidyl-tRNA hydrolase [Nocardioidaceae bacterium]|nr:acVLRF1 family peptidyl-tRNA hydrolase [Nocardioidaceae bacterium]
MSGPEPRDVAVPFERLAGWIDRYEVRHADTTWSYGPDQVTASSADGSSASIEVPFPPLRDLSRDGLTTHVARPWRIGVVIVRKGGFAVARAVGAEVVAVKIGQRHVQSRSKAGGWSQQRFARRRDNQAQAAYDAASGHVHEILLPHVRDLDLLATAGDRAAVDAVFAFRGLTPLLAAPQRWIPGVADPRRAVLNQVITSVRSAQVTVVDTTR